MYSERIALYAKIEKARESRLLAYVTGDRQGMETQIHPEVLDRIADHVDGFGLPNRISLYLYSRGGNTLAGWSIVNLLRQFCDDLEVIVPAKAHSTATLIAMGADRVLMTKQATLGPIDPSVNGPLNPPAPGQPPNVRVPISVEDVTAYFELARNQLAADGQADLAPAFVKLTEQVHPIALGNVYRARQQIKMLATRLLEQHMRGDDEKIGEITKFLCSESGSHDYTMNRREAEALGLPIEKPGDELYKMIKSVYDDVREELELNSRYNPNVLLAGQQMRDYEVTRALIESTTGGTDKFISKGTLTRQQLQTPVGLQEAIKDERKLEGWRHEDSELPQE